MDNPYKTITLQYPVTAMGQTISSVPLRRPRIKDLRHLSGPTSFQDPIGAQNAFLSAVSEMPAIFFEEMDVEDGDKFVEYVETFTKAEKTPASSSATGA